MAKTYVFCGPPGVGKDTQAYLLVERLKNFQLIGSGDMFRKLYKKRTNSGIEASKFWKKGKLVPARIYEKVLEEWLGLFDQNKDWLLVGAVRDKTQVGIVDRCLKKVNRKLDKVICFVADDNVVTKRITNRLICPVCGRVYNKISNPPKNDSLCDDDNTPLIQRVDDTLPVIKKRLEVYHNSMDPVIDIYKKRNVLVIINADRDFDSIYNDLVSVIKND